VAAIEYVELYPYLLDETFKSKGGTKVDPRIGGVIALVVVLIIASSPIIPQEEVTRYTSEPYSFTQELVREKQVRPFPWFREVTQAQYLIKNTDYGDGTFTLNCLFDNGSESEIKTIKIDLSGRGEKSVSIDSPLSGKSTVSLSVVPPYRSIAQKQMITKNVSVWYFVNPLRMFFK
jgi:hypothetical protein